MGRPRKPSRELRSLEECNQALRELLNAQTRREEIEAQRDREMAAVSARYEPETQALLRTEIDCHAQLKDYYYAHVAEIETGGRRSLQLANGVIGRRLTPPALKPRNSSWTWRKIMLFLREKFGRKFEREAEPTLDRELIKAEIDPDKLGEFGMRLEQDEVFYAEPHRPPSQEVA